METKRLTLRPFKEADFTEFVEHMLTDPEVVRFYYSYQKITDVEAIYSKARSDFWHEFEESRAHGYEVFAAREKENERLLGWSGLVHTELAEKFSGPELQYMLASFAHGKGFATELASAVLEDAKAQKRAAKVIATVDIPNTASVRVLEKVRLSRVAQIEAYGSTEMLLYETQL